MKELVFEVTQESDGGFVAECLTESIFTQADTWEELRLNVKEAVAGHHFDESENTTIRLHLIRDELLVPAGSCREISAVMTGLKLYAGIGGIGVFIRLEVMGYLKLMLPHISA